MQQSEILLDEEAQRLFESLGGMDIKERGRDVMDPGEGLAESLDEEEKQMDDWRILLVEFVYLFAGYLSSVRLSGLTPKHKEDINALTAILTKLSQMPNQGGEFLIRYRGVAFSSDRTSEESDYLISFRDMKVDMPIIQAVTNRQGITLSHLPGRLTRAFDLLASMAINTLHFDIGAWRPEDKRMMSLSLQILPRYFIATGRGHSDSLKEDNGQGPPPVVYNENGQPDPNLTLLAGLNGLKPKTIQGLVQKVNAMMNKPGFEHYSSVYGAISSIKQLRKQLVKPPVEINNTRWLMVERGQELASKEKAQVARRITEKLGESPQQAAEVMQGIYGGDFPDIGAETLESRLGGLTDFLEELEKSDGDGDSIENEVLQNVERRLDEVPDEVLDDLIVEGNEIQARTKGGETVKRKLNSKLSDMVSFFKRRTGTKKKIKEMMVHAIDFDDQDYETIARDFEISVEESKDLLGLLKGCFDKEGRFLRGAFEKNIPRFARHEEKIFGFLWHYLKEIRYRNDRVAFLNSLQSLIAKMRQNQGALITLLEDFCHHPQTVTFPDRNSLMVANVLLRKYNKELRNDVEITPEEVLLVRDGLDSEVVQAAAGFIDLEKEKIFQKTKTIHENLKEALDHGSTDNGQMPAGYLVTLERELYIFMSLVGWNIEHKIVRGAVMEYGNPDSEVYHLKKSPEHQKTLLKLLQVEVRGLGRFKDKSDLPLLRGIRNREQDFLTLNKKSLNADLVKRVMAWVNASVKQIREQQ